jgi:hypothetical protein
MSVPGNPRQTSAVPGWARLADAIVVTGFALAGYVWLWGGRWLVSGHRISISPQTVLVCVTVVAAARHLVFRRPALHTRIHAATGAALSRRPALAAALPCWIVTRGMVLLAGLIAIVMFGYPLGVPRLSTDELWNLPYRWDAAWYVSIASGGYQWAGAVNVEQNLNFFPAFPLLMRATSLLVSSHLPLDVRLAWSGTVLSVAAFLGALVYLYRLFDKEVGEEAAGAGLLLIATYPFALFFSAPYTESLYLLGAVGAFFHMRRSEILPAACWALLVGLTRPNGFVLAVPLTVAALGQARGGRARVELLLVAAMPIVGMLAYSVYGFSLTGRPFVWAELQRQAWGRPFQGLDKGVADVWMALTPFGRTRTADIRRTSDALNGLGAVFGFATIWPVWRRLGLAYAVFIAVGVIVPLISGGVMSMGRLSAVFFPSFVWLGLAVPARHRVPLACAFAMGQATLAALFFAWRPIV